MDAASLDPAHALDDVAGVAQLELQVQAADPPDVAGQGRLDAARAVTQGSLDDHALLSFRPMPSTSAQSGQASPVISAGPW